MFHKDGMFFDICQLKLIKFYKRCSFTSVYMRIINMCLLTDIYHTCNCGFLIDKLFTEMKHCRINCHMSLSFHKKKTVLWK